MMWSNANSPSRLGLAVECVTYEARIEALMASAVTGLGR